MDSRGINTPLAKAIGNRIKFESIWASGTQRANEETSTPNEENVREDIAIATKTRSGLGSDCNKIKDGTSRTRDMIKPNKTPAKAFPKTTVNIETGAVNNLSNVPFSFSRTTDTASMDVVEKRIERAVKPVTRKAGSILTPTEKARNKKIGTIKPYVRFGALK